MIRTLLIILTVVLTLGFVSLAMAVWIIYSLIPFHPEWVVQYHAINKQVREQLHLPPEQDDKGKSDFPALVTPWQTEAQWTVGDISQMVALGAQYGKDQSTGVPILGPVTKSAGGYTLTLKGSSYTVSTGSYAWDPGIYQDIAVKEGAISGSVMTPLTPILPYLVEPTADNLLAADRIIDTALNNTPTDGRLHVQAAELLLTFALRENAGIFFDQRHEAHRAVAHLALARAYGVPEADPDYLQALAALQVVAGRLVSAQAVIKTLPLTTKEDKAWAYSLQMLTDNDWRGYKAKTQGTLLEYYCWQQSVVMAAGTNPYVLSRSLDKEHITVLQARAFFTREPLTVSLGTLRYFAVVAPQLELGEIKKVEAARQESLMPANDSGDGFKLTLPSQGVTKNGYVILDDGIWEGALQRHLLADLMGITAISRMLDGDTSRITQSDELKTALHTLPLGFTINMEFSNNQQDYDAACLAAGSYIAAHPERTPAGVWVAMRESHANLVYRHVVPEFEPWYATDPVPGVMHDITGFTNLWMTTHLVRKADTEKWLELAAPSPDIQCTVFSAQAVKAGRGDPKAMTEADIEKMAAIPCAPYTPAWLMRIGTNYSDVGLNDKALPYFTQAFKVLPQAGIPVEEYYLNKKDMVDAEATFKRMELMGLDPITMSDSETPLVEYYLANGRKGDALILAAKMAAVYSDNGLETFAHVCEELNDTERAEDYYKRIVARYQNDLPLLGFYARHKDDSNYSYRYDQLVAKHFPDGLHAVELTDFTSPPPSPCLHCKEIKVAMQKAGINEGDAIVAINGFAVSSDDQVSAARRLAEHGLTIWWTKDKGYQAADLTNDDTRGLEATDNSCDWPVH